MYEGCPESMDPLETSRRTLGTRGPQTGYHCVRKYNTLIHSRKEFQFWSISLKKCFDQTSYKKVRQTFFQRSFSKSLLVLDTLKSMQKFGFLSAMTNLLNFFAAFMLFEVIVTC
jgi:hypothetical protein